MKHRNSIASRNNNADDDYLVLMNCCYCQLSINLNSVFVIASNQRSPFVDDKGTHGVCIVSVDTNGPQLRMKIN